MAWGQLCRLLALCPGLQRAKLSAEAWLPAPRPRTRLASREPTWSDSLRGLRCLASLSVEWVGTAGELQAGLSELGALTGLTHLGRTMIVPDHRDTPLDLLDVSPLARLTGLQRLHLSAGRDAQLWGMQALAGALTAVTELDAWDAPSPCRVPAAAATAYASLHAGSEGAGVHETRGAAAWWPGIRTLVLTDGCKPGQLAALQPHRMPQLQSLDVGKKDGLHTLLVYVVKGPAGSPQALQAMCQSLAGCTHIPGARINGLEVNFVW